MTLHVFEAKTGFGNFSIAVLASEYSRTDAITVAHREFGGQSVRVSQEKTTKRKLDKNALEVKSAKGWAWVWRA